MEIVPPDEAIQQQIKKNWDSLAKPLDGLGMFETIFARIGAMQGNIVPDIRRKAVMVMCADNGIVEEHISQSGQEVTAMVAESMGQGNSSVCKMAAAIGCEVIPVDIGINTNRVYPGVLPRKISRGTANFLRTPAMTKEQACAAINVGIELVEQCKQKGYGILGTGEMGIGNTTTSSAMAAALLGCPAERVTGRGAGLDDTGLKHKQQVIEEALQQYQLQPEETLRILCCVGGLDIAGMVGVFLGGALYHVPVVIDGVISAVAAVCASRLCPGTEAYMIPSHKGKEPAAGLLLQELSLQPVLEAGLALGEGTGTVFLFSMLDVALTLYREGTTFADIALAPYERYAK